MSAIESNLDMLSQLPQELIEYIVELVSHDDEDATTPDTKSLLALSLVSQKFKQLAQPVLFRDITFRRDLSVKGFIRYPYAHYFAPSNESIVLFHRTLKENAELRRHCRSIIISAEDFRYFEPPKNAMTEEIMGWLAGLQQLKFHGLSDSRVRHYGHPHNWEFLSHIITRCHDIRYLELDGSTHTHVFLSSILKLPSVPKLEKLIIRGLASQNDVLGLKTEQHRTASFTDLTLSHFAADIYVMRALLLWPTALNAFSFNAAQHGRNVERSPSIYARGSFELVLLPHKETLVRVTLTLDYRQEVKCPFNATLFPNLEYLRLSTWRSMDAAHFNSEHANVLGPRLKTFVLGPFGMTDYTPFSFCDLDCDFTESHASWLRILAETAVMQNAALEKIIVECNPTYLSRGDEDTYPWHLVDDIREQVLRPSGREITTMLPILSKIEWCHFYQFPRAYTWSRKYGGPEVIANETRRFQDQG